MFASVVVRRASLAYLTFVCTLNSFPFHCFQEGHSNSKSISVALVSDEANYIGYIAVHGRIGKGAGGLGG